MMMAKQGRIVTLGLGWVGNRGWAPDLSPFTHRQQSGTLVEGRLGRACIEWVPASIIPIPYQYWADDIEVVVQSPGLLFVGTQCEDVDGWWVGREGMTGF
ncbi:hypothetical protein LX32DRAFT_228489 [Colletotrichum zoysiae]|uniref:Uncharacterized protein n=1 Tax=Colletotrichum zoysiae TaxID=1216348 RepID=A0AAD9M821_9PEZI|nr:hypothetical protein LX32DRAFT_228489 [Colletotrichum zoysiae]